MILHIEAAPLEGVTKAAFRRIHRQLFSGVDRYYSPFLSPSGDGVFSKRELADVILDTILRLRAERIDSHETAAD